MFGQRRRADVDGTATNNRRCRPMPEECPGVCGTVTVAPGYVRSSVINCVGGPLHISGRHGVAIRVKAAGYCR